MSKRKSINIEEFIKNEICPRVEKYPDLPEDEFIPIQYEHKEYGKLNADPKYTYLINKKGEVWSVLSNRKMNSKDTQTEGTSNLQEYSTVTLQFGNKKRTDIRIHILVASTFLINSDPNKFTIVNHIDHNTKNNKLSNLEYVTKAGNNCKTLGKSRVVSEEKRVIYIGKDNSGKEVYRFTSLNIPEGIKIDSVMNAIKSGKPYKDYFWTKENSSNHREKLYKTIGYSGNLNDYAWLKHPLYDNLYVCKEGFIRYKYRVGGGKNITDEVIGGLGTDGYVSINIKKGEERLVDFPAHRIIMEYLVGRYLRKDELVDHINTIRWDNSFSNLRITDTKGNSNNETTIINKSVKIYILDLYGNIIKEGVLCKDAYNEIYGHEAKHASYNTRMSRAEGIVDEKYVCIDTKKLSEELLFKNLKRAYYVFDEEETKILGVFLGLEALGRSGLWKRDIKTITHYYKTSRALDGLKILKIEDAKDILIKLGKLNVLKKLNQTENKETNN